MCLVTALVEEFISEVPNWYRFEVLDEDMTKFIRGGGGGGMFWFLKKKF